MQPVEIKKDIWWIGAVEYDKRNFHGYTLATRGTTYNAYLIKDEKTVLCDTVDHHSLGTMLCRMGKITEFEKIDYIICHHIELDHAGALVELVERCKPEKIFCSEEALKSMSGYFDRSNWPVQTVKTGDKLNIGKRNLTFFETRMLHWPDSMVSYVHEDKLLFSQDAFGQNIASSQRFCDEYNREDLLRAVKEYYYNIILPYSPLVLRALDSLGGLDIDMIAPDHGLIFRKADCIKFILETYKAMAEQKPQKRAVVIYDTMWESTMKMAYSIVSGLEEAGVPGRIMSLKANHHSQVMTEVAESGIVAIGSPTHNNTILPPVAGMLTYMKGLRPKNKIGAAFGSHGWSGEGTKVINEWLSSMGMDMPCDPVKSLWGPNHDTLKACHAMGKTLGEALCKKIG